MFITIINDCKDANAQGRQTTRVAGLFKEEKPCISFVGVENDIEAAGNLIDILDAGEGEEGIVLVNVAPRNGKSKKWENGTPFGYFKYRNMLIVSSIEGFTLSLIKKLKIADHINVVEIPPVIKYALANNLLTKELGEYIKSSQFRSYDYLPRVAKWLWDKKELPFIQMDISTIENIGKRIWYIDNFGNCKTTITNNDYDFIPAKAIESNVGNLIYYNRLKDVPNNEKAFISGSSGLNDMRFIEVVIQGNSAKKEFMLHIGDEIAIV